MDKKYKSITEVSKLLDIKTHVIRYWDSKFDGLSTRIDNKSRFFNHENIKKLKQIKKTLYYQGKHNYTLDLTKKLIKYDANSSQSILDDKNNNLELSLKEIRDNLSKLIDL